MTLIRRWDARLCSLLLIAAAATLVAEAAESPPLGATATSSPARLRYPVALALAARGNLLLTANQRSGSVSLVDLDKREVVGETPVGQSLTDIVTFPGQNEDEFLVTDDATHKLSFLRRRGTELHVLATLDVSPYPVSVRVDQTGGRCYVVSQWSRSLTIVDLVRREGKEISLTVAGKLAFPFVPRLQSLFPDGKTLVVADAFGGNLAVVELESQKLVSVKKIPAQNIRGLAWNTDGTRLLVAHQTLNAVGRTTTEDLHWGSVVSNVVRSLSAEAVKEPSADVLRQNRYSLLGVIDNGAGDPSAMIITPDGRMFVALAGVGELALGDLEHGWQRVPAGIRPTALIRGSDDRVYAADTFGDAIFVFDPSAPATISLGPQPQFSAAERGERLFFNARLGQGKWMSCHSCHSDGQSSDGLSDTLGDDSYGAAKRIPPLGGVAETGPWGWSGNVPALADQVRKSFETTLRAKKFDDDQVRDLVEYLHTLQPAPHLPSQPGFSAKSPDEDHAAIERGRTVFETLKCNACHVPPTFTSSGVYDVGYKDELGNQKFNPPSLRGIGQRAAYFHDGRAASLEEVLTKYRHQTETWWDDDELADLLAFLRSL